MVIKISLPLILFLFNLKLALIRGYAPHFRDKDFYFDAMLDRLLIAQSYFKEILS